MSEWTSAEEKWTIARVHNWTDTDRQQDDCQLIIIVYRTVENYTTELNVLS